MSDPPRSGSNDDAGTSTQCGILNWEKEEDLDVAVIESTLIVEEIDQQRRRLVRKALSVSSQAVYFRGNLCRRASALKHIHLNCQVFNIIIEDNHQIRSLVRYIDDFDEFDQKVSMIVTGKLHPTHHPTHFTLLGSPTLPENSVSSTVSQ